MRVIRIFFGKLVKLHSENIFFETGSNATGFWIKISDRIMLCFHTTTQNNSNLTWVYPHEFVSPPVVFAFPTNSTDVWQVGGQKTAKQVAIQAGAVTYFNLFAIGPI